MIRKFDFNDDTRSSVPTLETWLYSLKLEELMEPLDDMGVVELADLADIDDRELASLNLNRLQLKHWKMGLFQALSAREEAALDGKLDMPTFRGWLESWRLGRLKPRMEQLGVYMQQDLLDLEPNEYQLLEMRPLEAKRFEQAMIALEEEFLTPAPDSDQEFRVSHVTCESQGAARGGGAGRGGAGRAHGAVDADAEADAPTRFHLSSSHLSPHHNHRLTKPPPPPPEFAGRFRQADGGATQGHGPPLAYPTYM